MGYHTEHRLQSRTPHLTRVDPDAAVSSSNETTSRSDMHSGQHSDLTIALSTVRHSSLDRFLLCCAIQLQHLFGIHLCIEKSFGAFACRSSDRVQPLAVLSASE